MLCRMPHASGIEQQQQQIEREQETSHKKLHSRRVRVWRSGVKCIILAICRRRCRRCHVDSGEHNKPSAAMLLAAWRPSAGFAVDDFAGAETEHNIHHPRANSRSVDQQPRHVHAQKEINGVQPRQDTRQIDNDKQRRIKNEHESGKNAETR